MPFKTIQIAWRYCVVSVALRRFGIDPIKKMRMAIFGSVYNSHESIKHG
jgi:hypothetical protein